MRKLVFTEFWHILKADLDGLKKYFRVSLLGSSRVRHSSSVKETLAFKFPSHVIRPGHASKLTVNMLHSKRNLYGRHLESTKHLHSKVEEKEIQNPCLRKFEAKTYDARLGNNLKLQRTILQAE